MKAPDLVDFYVRAAGLTFRSSDDPQHWNNEKIRNLSLANLIPFQPQDLQILEDFGLLGGDIPGKRIAHNIAQNLGPQDDGVQNFSWVKF